MDIMSDHISSMIVLIDKVVLIVQKSFENFNITVGGDHRPVTAGEIVKLKMDYGY